MVSGSEIFVIIFIALLLFGSKRIPEVARGLGKGYRELKKVTDDLKHEITKETDIDENLKDLKEMTKLEEIAKMKDTFKI